MTMMKHVNLRRFSHASVFVVTQSLWGRRSLCLSLLNIEEHKESHYGESTETNGADIKGRVAPADWVDLKQVAALLRVCRLPIGHFLAVRIKRVGAYEVRGFGHVALDHPLEPLHGSVRSVVGFGHDFVLACLVPGEFVLGLSPRAVLLADGRIAQLHLYGFVGRVCPRW